MMAGLALILVFTFVASVELAMTLAPTNWRGSSSIRILARNLFVGTIAAAALVFGAFPHAGLLFKVILGTPTIVCLVLCIRPATDLATLYRTH
jgi:hypothetical protein